MADTKELQMKYFVLKPRGTTAYAAASRKALRAYADAIQTTNLELAIGLRVWSIEAAPQPEGGEQ